MHAATTSELTRLLIAMRDQGLDVLRKGPHNLRTVAQIDGVEYIDDSGSTFLDATLLSIVDLGKPLVWIAGAPMLDALDDQLRTFLKEHVDAVVFYGHLDQGAVDALDAELGQVYNVECLRTAVFAARELARPGSKVLFSPACPCGAEAANHAERATHFKHAVNDL